ncbi:ABC transporter substrate-binding protein [Bosea sp. (in: a-proteobacteria)]|jgi:branched-chain amino acid transport system substrate-binding protein|uniref:ABC transporter substrate-binding protein n=1 Tax=Bosea sp. (in: a-proteobacteria) TaxID=1871050 RepID=UPI002DDD1374|nr:ABC transporter substrate-binding protein [Bosea sp. (in: a-proteobacteria)]HEV2510304.1 ABC transporter substrate-binding protein [Bosea sp. (in: a-proteobacteria)]
MKTIAIAAAAGLVGASLGQPLAVNAQTVSDDVVKIGVLTDMSGLYADNVGAGAVLAARMAMEDFGGKVAGKTIEIVYADHQNKADIGSAIANRWYDVEKVDAITEVVSSAVALSVQQISKDKNRVFLATGPGTPDLTGKACSPVGVHWAYDNYALGNVVAGAVVRRGLKSWFFLTADYSFGHALEEQAARVVKENGGEVKGNARHPLGTADLSSFLLRAQSSGSQVIGLANAGSDMINSLKQAREFGITAGGQNMAALLVNLPDTHAMGLEVGQDLIIADSFYWDMDDSTRTWSKRFMERFNGKAPGSLQAAVYGAVTHYLKSIDAAKTDEAKAVSAKMRELPINDFYTKDGKIRSDGRVIRNMYLLQIKKPSESKYPWDYYKVLTTVPGDQAFRPQAAGGCSIAAN